MGGGTLGAALPVIGSVTGGPFPATVNFTNSTALNDFAQAIPFGNSLSFFVLLDGTAITAPSGTAFSESSFSLSLFSSDFSTNLLTTNPSGVIGQLDLNTAGKVTLSDFPPSVGAPSLATITLVATPEPATGMISVVLLVLCGLFRFRKPSKELIALTGAITFRPFS